MNVPFRAFVSSTFADLKKHRRHVIDALRGAGFFVDRIGKAVAKLEFGHSDRTLDAFDVIMGSLRSLIAEQK